jgi:carboxyl-terminal processing protease
MKQNIFLSFSKKVLLSTLICVPLFSLVFWQQNGRVSATPQQVYEHLEIFANIFSILEQNYVEEIDPQEVIQGAIRGMLSALDPHSSYLKPEDFRELQVETTGSFSGIGIEITLQDSTLTVVSPIEGTPAFDAGLRAGDRIIKIGDELTQEMTLMEAVQKLRGPKGSRVTISIHREGWNEVKEFTITREVIPLHSVNAKMLEPGFGYLRITSFQAKTTADLKQALKELEAKNELKGVILDLRNNPGGLLDQAVKVTDIFLDEGVIVSTKGRIKEQNMVFNAQSNGGKHHFPMVVLVNEGSASASEIVAGALKDHGRALILGAQTFGKGSVQTIMPLSEGAGLRLTTARYYTPSGISIQAKGISPDILVPTRIADQEQPESTKKNESHRFLREKDLRHHIPNGDEPNEKDREYEEKGGQSDDNPDEQRQELPLEAGMKEIENDPQLHTALVLLKGLDVFNGLKSESIPGGR